jgi:hypothetical protein
METLTQSGIRTDDAQHKAYSQRVQKVSKGFDSLGRGARIRCARELRMAPAQVSNVLNLNYLSLATLGRIEGWLKGQ